MVVETQTRNRLLARHTAELMPRAVLRCWYNARVIDPEQACAQ